MYIHPVRIFFPPTRNRPETAKEDRGLGQRRFAQCQHDHHHHARKQFDPNQRQSKQRAFDSPAFAFGAPSFTPPFAPIAQSQMAGLGFNSGGLSLEPTMMLNECSNYLDYLHELRRINEGSDTNDSPGYALDLVQVPILVFPGKKTRKGYGAEITITATPYLTPELLPATFHNLVTNDFVDLLAPALFALDPVVDQQNIEDAYSRRRELQIALAMGFVSGRINAQGMLQFSRKLEWDMATVALKQTVIGFSHGDDTFGWRFYPRFHTPPNKGNVSAFWESIAGGPTTDQGIRDRHLEPMMRECVVIVVMPSFVPYVTFESHSRFVRLTDPKCTEISMRQTMLLSRSTKVM